MQKGIAEINVSDSDELRLKKINENFKNLVTGATPVGAIATSGDSYSRIINYVGGTLSTDNSFAKGFSSYVINAEYITANTIGVNKLLANYAYIDLANVEEVSARRFYADSGLVKDLTTEGAWTTGTLAAVKITADSIQARTITAEKIKFKDGTEWTSASDFQNKSINQCLIAALNAEALGGAEQLVAKLQQIQQQFPPEIFQAYCQAYDSQIDGTIIMANTIVAEKVKVSDLEAFHATIGGFTINGDDGGLVGNLPGGGLLEFRPNGFFHAGSGSSYIEVDPTGDGRVDVVCNTTNVKEDITIANKWKWDLTSSGALNLLYIGQ